MHIMQPQINACTIGGWYGSRCLLSVLDIFQCGCTAIWLKNDRINFQFILLSIISSQTLGYFYEYCYYILSKFLQQYILKEHKQEK